MTDVHEEYDPVAEAMNTMKDDVGKEENFPPTRQAAEPEVPKKAAKKSKPKTEASIAVVRFDDPTIPIEITFDGIWSVTQLRAVQRQLDRFWKAHMTKLQQQMINEGDDK